MNLLEDLISTLDFDTVVRDIRQGVFHTAVLSRHCGLSATLPMDAMRQDAALVREPGFLLSKSPRELAGLAHSKSILEAAIGMATINSLLTIDEGSVIELNAADLILEKGEGRTVAIVGHFPFVPKVREKAKALWVIEKNPKEGDLPESEGDQRIRQADVVAITGAALVNHTLDRMLQLCNPRAFVILLGPTVPLSPVLFEYGVDALSGTRVADPDLALLCVSQGANFRQIPGARRLTMMKPGRS